MVMVMTCCRRPRAQPRPGGGPAADRLLPRPRPGAAAARARGLHRQPRPHQPGLLRGQPLRWPDIPWWYDDDDMIHDSLAVYGSKPGLSSASGLYMTPAPHIEEDRWTLPPCAGSEALLFLFASGAQLSGWISWNQVNNSKNGAKCHSFIMCKLAPGNKGAGTPLATAPSIDNMLTMPTYCDLLPRCVQVFLLFSRHRNKSNKKLL